LLLHLDLALQQMIGAGRLARKNCTAPNRAIDPKFRRDEVEKTSLIR
jgi:hypothetical protein